MAANKLFLGNIITMEPGHPTAQALVVTNGRVQFAGSVETAQALCDEQTQVLDFGENYLYPGIIEGHCHPDLAGVRLKLQADLTAGQSMTEYVDLMAAFIKENPGAHEYRGAGWLQRECMPTAAMLDAICPDVPVVMNSIDGHSMWLNTPALEKYGIDRACIDFWGTGIIRVDEQGKPTGYISEGPTTEINSKGTYTAEQKDEAFLAWQDFAFAHGLTACLHAGITSLTCKIYQRLIERGVWKLRTFGVLLLDEREPDYLAKVQMAKDLANQYNNEYFQVVGIKVFMDGVVEAHTAWTIEDYTDDPGNTGVKRMRDLDRVSEMIAAATREGMLVHCHTIGDGAVKFAVDSIEKAEKETGDFTARHALCHLQMVQPEDVKRMADLRITPVVAPLWTPYHPVYTPQTTDYIGEERMSRLYPIKSYIDAGAPVAFHTDFPVSTEMDVPRSMYTAVTRCAPGADGPVQQPHEVINRKEALAALTRVAAYSMKAENSLGQLAPGFVANITVFDKNFLEDDIEEVAASKLLATIIDGDIVYSA